MCWSFQVRLTSVLLFVLAVVSAGRLHHIEKRSNMCLLPPYPEFGQYEVAGDPSALPGDELEYVFLNVSCTPGKDVVGNNVAICIKGEWSTTIPQCVSMCQLPTQAGVEFNCRSPGEEDYRPCSKYEATGSTTKVKCLGGYYSPAPMPIMRCVDGYWDYSPTCVPECGIVSKGATTLPWHAIIYRKQTNIFRKLCGGTIITATKLLSAAHCFWNSHDLNIIASVEHAVAVGKSTQGWDITEQKYLVIDVKIPVNYNHDATNFQADIAVVKLDKPIQFSPFVRPVCIDFDHGFEQQQLRSQNFGKMSYWSDTRNMSSKLEIMEIPYIPIDECIKQAPFEFREYITSDKMCAGFKNGTLLCRGNSGGGLVFPDVARGITRYYLRGIISTAPNTDRDNCVNDLITFTLVSTHEHFVKPLLV